MLFASIRAIRGCLPLHPFVLFVVKNPPGEELNHDGTTDTTEEEMKSVEPPINADKRQ